MAWLCVTNLWYTDHQTHYAIMRSLSRENDIILTSKWRRFDVITTFWLRHVIGGEKTANTTRDKKALWEVFFYAVYSGTFFFKTTSHSGIKFDVLSIKVEPTKCVFLTFLTLKKAFRCIYGQTNTKNSNCMTASTNWPINQNWLQLRL